MESIESIVPVIDAVASQMANDALAKEAKQ